MSFTKRGRSKRAEQVASRKLGRLFKTAKSLSLNGSEGWLNHYAMGFLWRHVMWGQQSARDDFWWGYFGWLIRNYPNDDEQRRLFLKLVPAGIGIPDDQLREHYDAARATIGNGGDFERGVGEADRVLGIIEQGRTSKDDYGNTVTRLERSFRNLPGRHPLARWIGLELPSKFYPYLVAHTLGLHAFGVQPDDTHLAQILGLS